MTPCFAELYILVCLKARACDAIERTIRQRRRGGPGVRHVFAIEKGDEDACMYQDQSMSRVQLFCRP